MMRTIEPKMLYFGTPVVLISSLNDDGTTNAAPMSSAWWVGRTAMLGMSVNSQTVHNLTERPLCVLNLVDLPMVDAIDRLALLTGRRDVPGYKKARSYRYEPDKFAAAGLTPVQLTPDGPLAVAESPVQMEAEVRAIHSIDSADAGLRAMEAAVLATHVDEKLLLPGHKHHFDPLAWDPLIMKFTEYFAGGTNARPSSLAAGWGMPALTH
ncbi:flavin reductase family protein [Kribbella sp. NPDC026611]|uniref:flavin reductase family protein n=1 Tax=Kribbella sp. NPDC026611 TaxID=3154911 RepID=UPI003409311B